MPKTALTIPQFLTPRPDPAKPQECRDRPLDMSFKTGVLFWQAQLGQTLQTGETVACAEVEKMTVDIPSPAAGTLVEQCIEEGDVFFPGDVLGYLETEA